MSVREIAILYVDDEELNLFIFKNNFESNYPVFTASSGEEGLEILKQNSDKIIVVISDMRMPTMSGIEFISKAKALYDNIVYFILTGYNSNKEIEQALEDKLIAKWFSKPFSVENIESAIQEALPELDI
ncbi:response regulator [Ekhidna sp.]